MKTMLTVLLLLVSSSLLPSQDAVFHRAIRPVPFTAVALGDSFWLPRLEVNRCLTIPLAMQRNEETGRVDNFRKAAGKMKGPYIGKRYNDSDVFKSMEAMAYALMQKEDPRLRQNLEELIGWVGQAQEKDGYLFTTRSIDPAKPAAGSGAQRWSELRSSHELYNMGHMYEAAVAHFQATGSKRFLDIAIKNADLLVATFGPGKRRGFPGHQEIEIGLAKLFRVTGRREYLDLALFFLDERGHYHNGSLHGPNDPFSIYDSEEYLQNHLPVLKQDELVGHAVRSMYMLAGMADVAALAKRADYFQAVFRLWRDLTERKMYLTGGVGSRGEWEGFGEAYELPNREAYCESCAAIGNALLQQRMFLQEGGGEYIDVLERVMYNGLLSGVSLDGRTFFYQNPLESVGGIQRSPWFEVACCPPNLARFLPSVPGYVYATRGENELFVNLFIANRARIDLGHNLLDLEMNTAYPWQGQVNLKVRGRFSEEMTLWIRIPGWARNMPVPGMLYRYCDSSDESASLLLNGQPLKVKVENGYVAVKRFWKSGDTLSLELPMKPRALMAHPAVSADAGRLAWQRGPLVYCLEGTDNDVPLDRLVVKEAASAVRWEPDLLNGVVTLHGQAQTLGDDGSVTGPVPVMAVPYYAWANRGAGPMKVWLAASAELAMNDLAASPKGRDK